MTAYEMRIGDWSSDVCSSDLAVHQRALERAHHRGADRDDATTCGARASHLFDQFGADVQPFAVHAMPRDVVHAHGLERAGAHAQRDVARSEESVVGEAGVSTCRFWVESSQTQ